MQKSYKREQLTPGGNAAVDQRSIKLEMSRGWEAAEPRGKRDQRKSRRLLGAPELRRSAVGGQGRPGSRMKRPGGGTAGRGRRREPGGAAGGREGTLRARLAKTAWRSAGAPGARGAHGRDAPAAARRAAGTVGRAGSGAPAPPTAAPRPAGPRRRAGADRAGRWRRRSPRREARAAGANQALRRFGRRAGDRGAGALIATVAPGVVDFFLSTRVETPEV